jgi:hypothetical protein
MHMLGHDHVTDDHKMIASAYLLQHVNEHVLMFVIIQPGPSLITTGRDEVQVACTILTMETPRHGVRL